MHMTKGVRNATVLPPSDQNKCCSNSTSVNQTPAYVTNTFILLVWGCTIQRAIDL